MKIPFLKLFAICLLAVLFANCDAESIQEEFNFSAEDSARAAQTDNVADGALSIIENAYTENEEPRGVAVTTLFPDCTTITIQPNGNGGSILLDFGTGCELNNGAFVTGSIQILYGPLDGGTRTLTYEYTNFTYNSNGISGGGTVVRVVDNGNGNPQSTVTEDITVSFPNTEITATRNATRISEWVEGVGSGNWQDNVYHITGNWETIFTNGFSRTGTVTDKLVRKLQCRYLVSGLLEISQQNITGVIDWGDGSCDNRATLEINGRIYDIVL
ncbi:hypothetical protein ACFQO1_08500 [Jejudonia soesokkakensis]|uniref:Lipoprotein n=1 Tax=Jejudonia soesokkakensis TaxID=1323432 RepID=A0ABW2MWA7_9FLAO